MGNGWKMRPESILARIDSGFRDIAGFEERLSINVCIEGGPGALLE